jgi:ATP-dependent DNA helicase DinG
MDEGIPSADRYLSATFDEGGYLSRAFDGYRPRAGQVAFAHAVDRAIVTGKHLLAEAGTGVGKSMGYGVPATYWAFQRGAPIVIATANNALVEQLVGKDLPTLQRILPWPFTFGLLKGRSNYLCEKRRLRTEVELGSQGRLFDGAGPAPKTEADRQLATLRAWATACHEAGPLEESGDKSDLPFDPPMDLWRRFSIEASDCTGKECRFHDTCFANTQQRIAREAKIIVTNYHMLLAHLVISAGSADAFLLPRWGALVCDEAHKLAGIAREMLGFRITAESVRRACKPIQKERPDLADEVQRAAVLFFPTMGQLRRDPERYPAHVTGDFRDAEIAAWKGLYHGLEKVAALLTARMKREAERAWDTGTEDRGDTAIALSKVLTLTTGLAAFVNPELDDAHVYFIEEDQASGRIAIAAHLVEPATKLVPWLFHPDAADDGSESDPFADRAPPVVLTSATLATGEGDFGFARHELGLPDTTPTLLAASPFDWARQCLFIVPEGLPPPNDKSFRDVVVAQLHKILLYAGGRTLALFTSRRMLEHAHSALAPVMARQGIRIFKQGDAPRSKLIADFKADIPSCLFGTESFWAGVDAPGETCSVVVIDRLPFPSPDDPIAAALAAKDPKAFWRHNVPSAILQFKQGFGRGVRSTACRCVVVCLDARLLSARYGKQFLRALPPDVPKTTHLDAIVEWLPPVTRDAPPPTPAPEVHDGACFCEACRAGAGALPPTEDEIPFVLPYDSCRARHERRRLRWFRF